MTVEATQPATPTSAQTPAPVAPAQEQVTAPAPQVEAKAEAAPAKAPEPAKVEEPKAEAAKPPPAPPKAEPRSAKFMAALEREKSLREQERRARSAAAELEKREAEFKSRLAAAGDPNADPVAYLERLGVPFDRVVKSITDREPPKVEDKVKELENKLEVYKREQAELARRAAAEQAKADYEEWQRQVVTYVQKESDKNELINAFQASEYVPQLISSYAQQYDKVLDVDEATQLVRDDLEKAVERIAATKWFQARYTKAQAETKPSPSPAKSASPGETKPESRTLSTSATATAAAVEQASRAPVSDSERRAKALEAFEAAMKRASGNP